MLGRHFKWWTQWKKCQTCHLLAIMPSFPEVVFLISPQRCDPPVFISFTCILGVPWSFTESHLLSLLCCSCFMFFPQLLPWNIIKDHLTASSLTWQYTWTTLSCFTVLAVWALCLLKVDLMWFLTLSSSLVYCHVFKHRAPSCSCYIPYSHCGDRSTGLSPSAVWHVTQTRHFSFCFPDCRGCETNPSCVL